MLSKTAEYALRGAVRLARERDTNLTTEQLAQDTGVPAGYLSKVLQALGKNGLVVSRKGLGGGFRLARDPEAISVLEVVNAVDPIQHVRTCPLGLSHHGATLCPLHRRLDAITSQVEEAFEATPLSDLVIEPPA